MKQNLHKAFHSVILYKKEKAEKPYSTYFPEVSLIMTIYTSLLGVLKTHSAQQIL
jgi:hypothetical protein